MISRIAATIATKHQSGEELEGKRRWSPDHFGVNIGMEGSEQLHCRKARHYGDQNPIRTGRVEWLTAAQNADGGCAEPRVNSGFETHRLWPPRT